MVIELEKEPYFEHCKELVKEEMKEYQLTDDELNQLTDEIMNTSVLAGGDYSDENIIFYAQSYIKNNFLVRFKMARDKDYGGYNGY